MIFTCGYCAESASPDKSVTPVIGGTVCTHCGASYRWDRWIAAPAPGYLHIWVVPPQP